MDPTTKLTTEQAAQLAQLSLRQRISAADLTRIALDIQLRQWCIEEANKVCGGGDSPLVRGEQQDNGRMKIEFATVHLASVIYDFVTAPLNEKAAP